MKVKRYIASDTQQAMLKVKTELGANAVILHSRKIKRPGIFGFLKKPLIEMVAAIEENEEKKENRHVLTNSINIKNAKNDIEKLDTIQDQVANIQEMLSNVITKFDTDKKDINNQGNQSCVLFQKYHNLLMKNDVDLLLIDKIMNIVKKQMSFTEENEDAIKNAIKITIRDYLGVPQTIPDKTETQKIIMLIGPTGVGKTTTLAKLAAKLSINEKKSIGIITSDTYRIAAVEQLRTYSEILSIPIKVIYEPEEIKESIKSFYDKDIILIDTAGRNHLKEDQLVEIQQILDCLSEPEIFLVISATTSYKDINKIVQSYNFIKDFKLLFTKLDESTAYGNILNTKVLTGKSLSYLTIGQSVPNDIEIANPDKIANLIVVGETHE